MNARRPPNLYLSQPHECSYLNDRPAATLFVDPHYTLDPDRFADFMRQGFRRSGDLVYRPHCGRCVSCVSVRVPVNDFVPNRGQRRTWKKNQDLKVTATEALFDPEHFDLFLRYQAKRHPGSGMADADPQKYMRFLVTHHVKTLFYEIRRQQRLLAVAVVDVLPDGLSAVYTFYEPEISSRGLGVYAVMWEIEHAKQLGLPWLYLGYWIKESPKMAYKINYRPLEMYHEGRWVRLEPDPAAEND
jgi:arginyl-tRNA--protein-N-Asp/Glu arginylyltransferase